MVSLQILFGVVDGYLIYDPIFKNITSGSCGLVLASGLWIICRLAAQPPNRYSANE